jgi:hypothetical protein
MVALAAPAAAGESQSDKALLKAGVITQPDVPSGWSSKKAGPSGQALRGVRECKQINTAVDKAKKTRPRARSREFSEPTSQGTTSAENTVYVFKDIRAASAFFAKYEDAQAPTCYEKGADKTASSLPAAGSPTVSPITDLQGVGDEAVGYEIVLPFTTSGLTSTLYLDIIAVRVGRVFLGFNFSNIDARIPDGPAIVQAVVARVTEAQASA